LRAKQANAPDPANIARTAIFDAARDNDVTHMKSLLNSHKVDVNAFRRLKGGDSLMHVAAKAGALEVLEELSARGK
jgi:hypothetical protein